VAALIVKSPNHKSDRAEPTSPTTRRALFTKLAFVIFGLLWVTLIYFSGTSKESEIWRRIAAADQVRLQEPWKGRMIARAFYGKEARRLIQAITTAQPLGGPSESNATGTIEFLNGSNRLAVFPVMAQYVYLNGKSYFVGDLPIMVGPIYFSVPDEFRGAIHLTIDATNGSSVRKSDGDYWVTVPADGKLRFRDHDLLHSWAERAYFITNRERIPVDTDPGSLGALPPDMLALRSLGTYATNGVSFIAFFLGTEKEAQRARNDLH
jgi:hypothetical protein